jgi:5'-nucleotidase / UDP-sugar diphosphatase
MSIFLRRFRLLACLALLLALAACARPAHQATHQPFTLTIAHVNDTHSNLEPVDIGLILAGVKVKAQLGGFARLKTALDEVRAHELNVLALHAGDAVQGTLFFNVFQGRVDFEFLNLLGLDAMALGNHEFDKGPVLTGSLVARARFPVLSANLDVSGEPALAGRIRPYVVRLFGAERVGIIGSTTPSTPKITASVGGVKFHKAAPAVAAAVRELHAQGVDRIIVLSHNGYEQDLALAREVPGIDVIVGGHSHTLLGDPAQLAPLGLTPAGPYPTEVIGPDNGRVLVVQAWRWGMQLGVLQVSFDAKGAIAGYEARPVLLAGDEFRRGETAVAKGTPEHAALAAALTASGAARIVPEDAGIAERLAPYARQLEPFRNARINARAGVDLIRGTATDPGPLVADAYLAAVPGAQLALLMPGGLRQDLFQGELTLGMVLGVLPFGNTLVTLDLSGAEFRRALEDAVDFRLAAHPPGRKMKDADWRKVRVFHAGGFTCTVAPGQPKGSRIGNLRVRQPDGSSGAMDPAATYRLVTNSFLAGGGDSLDTLKSAAGDRVDTGYLEHDALAEYLKALGVVAAPQEHRVVIGQGSSGQGAGAPAPAPVLGPVSWLPPCRGWLGQAA